MIPGPDNMISELQQYTTLVAKWLSNGREPFKAISENGTIVNIVGVSDGKAYGWPTDNGGKNYVKTFDANRVHWKTYVKPEPVGHWPAVKLSPRQGPDRYALSSTLYSTNEQAKKYMGAGFVRLAKEYTPIMLVPIGTQDPDKSYDEYR